MLTARFGDAPNQLPYTSDHSKTRLLAKSKEVQVLTKIYEEQTNIAIWERCLSEDVHQSVASFLECKQSYQSSMTVTPKSVKSSIEASFGEGTYSALSKDIEGLVDMFCCLFDLERVALRLTLLDRAMCPRFHVDRVPCRLLTTYQGIATEWLPHAHVNRSKLGAGNNGLADEHSGIYEKPSDIQRLVAGQVALLKGEGWEGNENAGLVHRSPTPVSGERRLLLTLDFSD